MADEEVVFCERVKCQWHGKSGSWVSASTGKPSDGSDGSADSEWVDIVANYELGLRVRECMRDSGL